MVHPKNIKLTVRDYMSIPDGDDRRFELIDGELILAPSPVPQHQMISRNLFRMLDDFVASQNLGELLYAPMDVVLSEHDVFQPDILFVSRNRLHIIGDRNIQGAPDLVIEILSPSTETRDRGVKLNQYLRYGVREYWIIDPQERTLEVLRAGNTEFETVRVYPEGATATSPVLEGIQVEVDRLFA
ncbi:MAG: Uma2 family endonuclease [Chloroflexi bacterium]|nr:Uma2 family endonuclease [Chloroflexota bacterium]